ncbi:MAG: hypothetical protein NVS2B7_18220 [Herpetosiphon sp.]
MAGSAVGLGLGIALRMLGGGGSILTVPILVYILRQDPHIAVATSLVMWASTRWPGSHFTSVPAMSSSSSRSSVAPTVFLLPILAPDSPVW